MKSKYEVWFFPYGCGFLATIENCDLEEARRKKKALLKKDANTEATIRDKTKEFKEVK